MSNKERLQILVEAGVVFVGNDPFVVRCCPWQWPKEKILETAETLEKLGIRLGPDSKMGRKAIWQAAALLMIATLPEGELTVGVGIVKRVTEISQLRHLIKSSVPLPPLFPEQIPEAMREEIKGEFWFGPERVRWEKVLAEEGSAFVVYPEGSMLICEKNPRHLAITGGGRVFAAGYLKPKGGQIEVVLKSTDYAIPGVRKKYVEKYLSLAGAPVSWEEWEVG